MTSVCNQRIEAQKDIEKLFNKYLCFFPFCSMFTFYLEKILVQLYVQSSIRETFCYLHFFSGHYYSHFITRLFLTTILSYIGEVVKQRSALGVKWLPTPLFHNVAHDG